MLKVLAILLPVSGLVLGLAYVRLLQGPISMRFLVAPAERALNAELPGLHAEIEDAIVRLSDRGGIEFRLRNVRVSETDGDLVAVAPLAAVQLSHKALLSGRIAASRLELIEPSMLVSRAEDGRLSLSFGPPDPVHAEAKTASADRPIGGGAPGPVTRRIDLARTFAVASARARRREDASSFLESIGLKNASMLLDASGRRVEWRIPEFDLRLIHGQKRSIISGSGTVASAAGPWQFTFRSEDSEKSKTVRLEATVSDLVPRGVAHGLPNLAVIEGIDIPISGSGGLELTTDGDILRGHFSLDLEPGRLYLPWLDTVPLILGSGRLDVRYNGETQTFDLGPSTISWGRSHVAVGGRVEWDGASQADAGSWRFDLRSLGGSIVGDDPDLPPLPVERLIASGHLGPEPGRVEVKEFRLNAGGAELAMAGNVATVDGRIEAGLEGTIGPTSIATAKALWPSALARRTRTWAAHGLTKGLIKGGNFRIVTSRAVDAGWRRGLDPQGRRLALSIEGEDLEIEYLKGQPRIEVPRALLSVDGNNLEIAIPEASLATVQGHRISLKSARFTSSDIDGDRPLGQIAVRAQAPLAAVLDVLEAEPIGLSRETGFKLTGAEGKAEGQFRVTLPLAEDVTASELKIEGKARITDGRMKQVFGSHDVHGATILIDATERAIDVKGDMLIGGVNMKVAWQRFIAETDGAQQPLKISARLDNSDRAQLGLDLNHMVQGEVPVEITVRRGSEGAEARVRLMADLTGAELILEDIAWRKPPGREATLQFDVGKGRAQKVELQNFKLLGEGVAIEGSVGLGSDLHADQYHFPGFSLNVVSNLDVQGVLRPGRVWDVKAVGKVYDANELFRTLIAFGQLSEKPLSNPKDRPGLDLEAEIDTVLGASDTTISGVKLKMKKRAEQLTMLEMRGTLEGGKPLTARLRQTAGRPRVLLAETPDAGQALKLIGFYPNMVGGTGELEINLDAKGPADRSGVLEIRGFRVLGDPIVSEVLQTSDEGRPAIDAARGGRRVVREQFDFDRLRAPFSMGSGQLVLENAQVSGPLVGASIRGKIDYKSQRLQLGGTYVPLSGVNASVAPIPIIGPLLTGPRGEGVLGITFAIQGPLANPQVIVNPLSLVVPGILREVFQMTPENPRITPREPVPSKGGKGAGPQVRSSRTMGGSWGDALSRAQPEILGGWTAKTTVPSEQGQ
jgi:hypothetical protein